ncbi:hypothetical protein JCM17823_29370 [Halorubrum gandharaense]
MSQENREGGPGSDDREIPELDPHQRRAVEAYLGMDSGLVTLASVPGAGKSTVAGKAVAAELLERTAAGDPRPHERLVSASFSREDASDIVPDVIAWIETLYERGEAPPEVDRAAVDRLADQLREAPRIGTVDSVLRSVFGEVATSVGFGRMPTVGNAALIRRVHADTFEAVADDFPARIERLREAYPDGEWDDGVDDMLRAAFRFTRRHDLSMDAFESRVRAAVERNFGGEEGSEGGKEGNEGGEPSSFDDLLADVQRYRGAPRAERVAEESSADEREALVAADRRIYREWTGIVGTFRTVLERYVSRYDAHCTERGVVSHLDCAYWVDRFFTHESHEGPRRRRLLARYHDEIESAVVDEAQDVSRIQHDALAHLIDADTRVLLAGDVQQCIYQWRDATPELFGRAIADGEYFGRVWEPRTNETADRNYRSRPGIVRLANAVAERTLNHPERGGLGDVDAATPSLHAKRDAGEGPSVHVAAFDGDGEPGSKNWVDPELGGREAPVVANYVAGALADGRFGGGERDDGRDEADDSGDGDQPSITVLFANRTHMDAYATCFENRGFTVANASAHLFASQSVRAVVDTVRWLVDPSDPARTRTLITGSALAGVTPNPYADDYEGFDSALNVLREVDWSVSDAAGADGLDSGCATVLAGLSDLQADARRLATEPAAVVVREVVDRLRLEADPLEIDPDTDQPQRVATLDALVALVGEWEGDDRYDNAELCTLFEPFLERPQRGPTQPVADPDAVDVVFRTIHSMKGDQDDVVVLADAATRIGPDAHNTDRFVAAGADPALAPPVSAVEGAPNLPAVSGGLYAPDADVPRRSGPNAAGLRWRPEYWLAGDASEGEDDPHEVLVGPPVRREAAAADRAESWRTLHVALTRASDHLVIPLPRDDDRLRGRDHWAAVLYDVLGSDAVTGNGISTVDLPDGDGTLQPTRVAVNGVTLGAVLGMDDTDRPTPPPRGPDPAPSTDVLGEAWLPRFVGPSTLAPLVEDPASALVPFLRGREVHTVSESVDDGLPLSFDRVRTETVGTLVHDLVAALADGECSAAELDGDRGRRIADELLERAVPDGVGDTEREGLRTFLHEWVLPDLATSALWSRVERAETVYTDEPLQAVTRIAGVELEVQGEADLLLAMPDGSWAVEDVKAALAEPTPAQRRRYRMQVDVYAWTLTRQLDEAATGSDIAGEPQVVPRVTTVGVSAEEYGPDPTAGSWREAVRGMAE